MILIYCFFFLKINDFTIKENTFLILGLTLLTISWSFIKNKSSLEEAIYLGIRNTKRYIKRQFTWWNNQKFSQLNLRINYKKRFAKDSIENISIYLNEQ